MSFSISDLAPLAKSMAGLALPTLTTILSDAAPFPLNLFAGPALSAIAAALGINPAAPDLPQQAAAAIAADPEGAKAKLLPVEDQHAAMARAAADELAARLADVQDARATEVSLVKSGSWLANANVILAAIVIVGFFATTLAVISHSVDASQTTIYLITILGTGFTMILNFYFGSSKGSADKTDALNQIASTAVKGSTAAASASLVNANIAARHR